MYISNKNIEISNLFPNIVQEWNINFVIKHVVYMQQK